jgi:hypothetical protein
MYRFPHDQTSFWDWLKRFRDAPGPVSDFGRLN